MLILKRKDTGFYYLGPEGEAYCYEEADEVPKEIRALLDVEAEYLDPRLYYSFMTGLYNLGIEQVETSFGRKELKSEEVGYIRKRKTERCLSDFLTKKRMKDYEALLGCEAYFPVQFMADGYLSILTMEWHFPDKQEPANLPVAFANRTLAAEFLKREKIRDRQILLYRMPNPCILMGKSCQILLQKGKA